MPERITRDALDALACLSDVARPDIVVIPGGPGQVDHMTGGPLREWLATADATSTWIASVCTGADRRGARDS
jgi:putative intracellular protease/amidase